ncbi:MAG: cyoD [Gammaproteobacteria bacterium]|jgi:cytochrome o ubiquinol oxidase operon protein cyoD|nr:cyoD [Gammaproteobacteria bacterium]
MQSQSPAQGHAPGINPHGADHHARSYLVGLGYAIVLTLASFWAASTPLVYGPAVPVLLGVLAIAQMGVHLAFFLHISSAPDQTNNFLALIFGLFVTGLVVFGSLAIMSHLNHAMVSMDQLMKMQR